ncbi:hypothetical protein [Paraburkholderia sp. JHI869]|uniref:hypothetical protein n=1 Tax=Paraburkholderia sp. JHI869 TaxID=3112959 RepID=UPI00316CFAC9
MNRHARLLKIGSEQASMHSVVAIPGQDSGAGDFPLTDLERGLLAEALHLLADTRARALQLATEFSRRQGVAAPDVHDFQLPTIVDLQRRFNAQAALSSE